MAKTMADAATSPQSIVVPPIRPAIADGAARVSGSVMRKIENTNSFQEKIRANTAVAAMPGISSGIVTRQNASKREQPSIIAASSYSDGTSSTKPFIIQIVNGRLNAA